MTGLSCISVFKNELFANKHSDSISSDEYKKSKYEFLLTSDPVGIIVDVINNSDDDDQSVKYKPGYEKKNYFKACSNKLLFIDDKIKTNDGQCKIFLFDKNKKIKKGVYKILLENQTVVIKPIGVVKENIHDNNKIIDYSEKNLIINDLLFSLKEQYTMGKKIITSATRDIYDDEWTIINNIALSPDFPDLIWAHVGNGFQYDIFHGDIDDDKNKINKTPIVKTSDIVKYKFDSRDMKIGKNEFTIRATNGSEKKYQRILIDWQNSKTREEVNRQIEDIEKLKQTNVPLFSALTLIEYSLFATAYSIMNDYINSEDEKKPHEKKPSIINNEHRLVLIKLCSHLHLNEHKKIQFKHFVKELEGDSF